MPTWISLLRAINLGQHNRIRMSELEAALRGLGFDNVKTYLQSGNVVFDARQSPAKLCEIIEAKIQSEFGLSVSVISRTREEMGDTIRNNPFLKEDGVDPSHLHVTFLASVPGAALEKLDRLGAEPDRFRCRGREVYLDCCQGYGRTKLSNQAIEKALAVRGTTRNWKTVNQVYQMAAGLLR
jgi:uncharacterized protein (DUF1697 family)